VRICGTLVPAECQLTHPGMIQQAKVMHPSEMEPLFWHVEDALHEGNQDRARGIFVILLYAAKFNPELVQKGLQPGHRSRLQELSYELFSSSVPKSYTPIKMRPSLSPRTIPFKKEEELQKYLSSHPEILADALGEEVRINGVEVEVGPEYRCDIVAEGKQVYAIELKIGQANHAVVSQCNKYCYYLKRKLRYNHYKPVQGVVIGNGFDEWSINELRREGIWCYAVKSVGDVIKLERIG